jgi:hypothetical protein
MSTRFSKEINAGVSTAQLRRLAEQNGQETRLGVSHQVSKSEGKEEQ